MNNVIEFPHRSPENPIDDEQSGNQDADVIELFDNSEQKREIAIRKIKNLAENVTDEAELSALDQAIGDLNNCDAKVSAMFALSIVRRFQGYPQLTEILNNYSNIKACFAQAALIPIEQNKHPTISNQKKLAILALAKIPGEHFGFVDDPQKTSE